MRKNGFQRPWNIFQILSISLYLGQALIYFLIIYPYLNKTLKIWITIAYSLLVFISITAYILATLIDPTDNFKAGDSQVLYCSICKDNKSMFSKHCARCDRCTYGFDHHCKWLNNCIGTNNYRWFIVLIVSSTLLCILGVVVGCFVFYEFSVEKNIDPKDTFFTSFFVLVWFVTGGFLINLICLHVYLKFLNLTTFQYFNLKRKKTLNYQSSVDNPNVSITKSENSNDLTKITINL